MKRIALTLAECNKIYLIIYRNLEIVKHKLPALQAILNNIRTMKANNRIIHIGNIFSDSFDDFNNISEESKMEILNVDLINTIESLILQIESNNINIKNINSRDKKVIDHLDGFLLKLNSGSIKESDFFRLELSLENLISIIHNFRRELKKTRYYSLLLITKLAISEHEDQISFDIWVIARYLAEFNRKYSFRKIKNEFLKTIAKQFRLRKFEIKTSLKLLKRELKRISEITNN